MEGHSYNMRVRMSTYNDTLKACDVIHVCDVTMQHFWWLFLANTYEMSVNVDGSTAFIWCGL